MRLYWFCLQEPNIGIELNNFISTKLINTQYLKDVFLSK
jgi:hypothetical protein